MTQVSKAYVAILSIIQAFEQHQQKIKSGQSTDIKDLKDLADALELWIGVLSNMNDKNINSSQTRHGSAIEGNLSRLIHIPYDKKLEPQIKHGNPNVMTVYNEFIQKIKC